VSTLVTAGLVVAAAGPAFAKSSISLRATPRSVAVGQHIHLTATGASDDFGGMPMRLCVDEEVGHGSWRAVACGREGLLRASVRAGHPGEFAFRAQLLAVDSHGHLLVDQTTPVVTVRVR
jgi:hypothetical protein